MTVKTRKTVKHLVGLAPLIAPDKRRFCALRSTFSCLRRLKTAVPCRSCRPPLAHESPRHAKRLPVTVWSLVCGLVVRLVMAVRRRRIIHPIFDFCESDVVIAAIGCSTNCV